MSVYRVQIACRYSNSYALWDEVHITSIFPPDRVYSNMVTDNMDLDTAQQLFRRIHSIIYHYIDEDSNYCNFELPMKNYTTYLALKELAKISVHEDLKESDIFNSNILDVEQLEFDEVEEDNKLQ